MKLTNEDITRHANLIADLIGYDFEEAVEMIEEEGVLTEEPIENFKKIAKSSTFIEELNGWELEGVQRKKGDTRTDMLIIECDGFLSILEH